MPDITPDSTPTPGQLLAGSPPNMSNAPLYSRPGQPPSLGAPPQQQQPAPTPQQAVAAKHHAIGKAASFLFGQQQDENGNPVKEKPGQLFRSLLAGALLGGAMGSEAHASGGSVGGFLGGLGRGASGVEQQQYQRQQQAQTTSQRNQELSLEQQKFEEEKVQHQATLEQWNIENLNHGREADYRDREQLEKEEAQEENIQRYAIANGAKLASIPHNDESGNGPTLMKSMIQNPQSFAAPAGYGRLITKSFDFSGLNHDAKSGWTENGKPVNWADHMKWSLYYVPQNPDDKKPVSMSGADWQKFYGVKGLDPAKTYNVDSVQHLVAAATSQRKNEREDFNQSFKEKHDALQGTISSARTNVTQLNSEKRELLRQGYTEDDDEVQDVEKKIEGEQKREQDAITEMHPRIRERVAKQAPTVTTQTGASPAVKPRAQKPSTAPPSGATMKVPGSDGNLHWSDGKNDLGVVQ